MVLLCLFALSAHRKDRTEALRRVRSRRRRTSNSDSDLWSSSARVFHSLGPSVEARRGAGRFCMASAFLASLETASASTAPPEERGNCSSCMAQDTSREISSLETSPPAEEDPPPRLAKASCPVMTSVTRNSAASFSVSLFLSCGSSRPLSGNPCAWTRSARASAGSPPSGTGIRRASRMAGAVSGDPLSVAPTARNLAASADSGFGLWPPPPPPPFLLPMLMNSG